MDADTLILDDTDENLNDDEEAQFFADELDEVGVGSNLEHTDSIEKFPQIDTVRNSSHGEFINEDLPTFGCPIMANLGIVFSLIGNDFDLSWRVVRNCQDFSV